MNQKIESLEELGASVVLDSKEDVAAPIVYERKVDALGRAYATGKKKSSIAKVWLKAGNGKITINNQDITEYLVRPVLRMIVNQPFGIVNAENQYDVVVSVQGGGLSGQADAIKHGVSKALFAFNPDYRATLKSEGFLTRDSRVVERKKYGKAKARRSYQFSKR
ncbi:MAG: 30S ribosomal protein S9 [Alphaproteobacteria bacterium]|jgi:small subunit ribosomal protein S9|nr:30S ribosomal protein S9 [Alphaproteobacteria bacterium]